MFPLYTHTLDAKNIKPLIWLNLPLYRNYDKLKNYLRQQVGEEYARLFARPLIQEGADGQLEQVAWQCEVFSDRPQILTQLTTEEQVKYRAILEQKLTSLLMHSQLLLESEDNESVRWGQLINKSLDIPGEDCVLCGDDTVVLAAWGFHAQTKGSDSYRLREAIPPLGPSIPSDQSVASMLAEQTVSPSERPPANSVNLLIEQSKHTTDQRTQSERDKIEGDTNSPDNKVEPVSIVNSIEEGERPLTPPLPPKSLWQRFWWVAMLLFLLIGITWSVGQCVPTNYLPAQPGVLIPIDSSKIVLDSAKVRYIVADRLNIALIGTSKDLEKFALAFKKQYPDGDYQIIYFEPKTSRLQIQVPAAKRDQVANNLKGQLPDFKLLIWPEGIIQRRQIDPAFQYPARSWYHLAVKAPEAWQYTQGDENLVVAIIDEGFDVRHPELASRVVSPYNIPAQSNQLTTAPWLGMHGTHVAGIALGASNNGIGLAGIAPNCQFMPVQIGDLRGAMGGTAVIDGLLYAIEQGASVVNMSLGMAFPSFVARQPPSQQAKLGSLFQDEALFWNSLYDEAESRNVTVILAGGNQNVLIGIDPMQRSEKVLVVSATDNQGQKAGFSNYGNGSALSAPGVHLFSSIPGGRFAFMDGTSMAAPVVTGGVALLKSVNPTLTFRQLKTILQQTGIPVYSPTAYVGNLIQLDKAVALAVRGRQQSPIASCPDIQQQIDSLLLAIEQLKQLCDNVAGGDTLKLPSTNTGLGFAAGRWKSTSDLVNSSGEFVELYFDFNSKGGGTITLMAPGGVQCSAPLAFNLQIGGMQIEQKSIAVCTPPPLKYASYSFGCSPDANGRALCSGQNQQDAGNNLRFNLIKIQ